MELKVNEKYHGFTLKETWSIDEIESQAYLFEHGKTAARLLYLKNDDNNKVFFVGFRTPPVDDSGTAHIIEHSVLCGSKKYPLKEPFVELIKSSLHTFLNAMTYPDKTLYPVASKNEADFTNLADVYCDAVFNPLIKENPYTFYQEGWHYHLENEQDPITINGVVYNEMKGVFSDPEEVMMRNVTATLYPDTPYAFESGGDPEKIPELSYERFMDFYNMYYHPSNSYIYYYGDTDILPHLEALNKKYLSQYEKLAHDSLPSKQGVFEGPVHHEISYPADDGKDISDKYFFSYNFKIGDVCDTRLSYAFNVLVNILMDSDSAILKKALIDLDIADEITYDYVEYIREPYFTIAAKNAREGSFGLFKQTIEKTLSDVVKNGIGKDAITAALNSYEFELREADSGNYPKGLIFGFDIMDSWLYDAKPGIHLQYDAHIKHLREEGDSAYYTRLIKEHLIDNKHSTTIMLSPKRGLEQAKKAAEKKKLEAYKASLDKKALANIADETKELLRRQSLPDSAEALASIPHINVGEISKLPEQLESRTEPLDGGRLFMHTDKCRGIVYTDVYFEPSAKGVREIALLSFVTNILGIYATEKYNEEQLANIIRTYIGDMDFNINVYPSVKNTGTYTAKFVFSVKALEVNTQKAYDISREVLMHTKIDDPARLMKTINEELSKFESKLIVTAQRTVFSRLNAMATENGRYADITCGIDYYRTLIKIREALKKGDMTILDELNTIVKRAVNSFGADVLVVCDKDKSEAAIRQAKAFASALPCEKNEKVSAGISALAVAKEGIIIPSMVSYVGCGFNYKLCGYETDYHLQVAKKYLTAGYLWNNIRVIGGAYGAMMMVDNSGNLYFVSYRDPKIKQTLDVYKGIADDMRKLDLSKSEVDRLIIGTMSEIDMPQPVYAKGRRVMRCAYNGVTYEDLAMGREAVLTTTQKDIKNTAGLICDVIGRGAVCVAAGESMLNDSKDIFDQIYKP